MIDLAALIWQFLQAQSLGLILRLTSWHLALLLGVLGVLSAFGLHFLLGHVLRFYRRKGRLAWWVAWPTLLVLLVSVQALLGAYLLGVQAPTLVYGNLTGGVTTELGRRLLEPAFALEPLAGLHPDEVPKDAIKDALRLSSELEYREALRERLTPPGELAAAAREGRARGPDVLVQIGLRWVTAPHNTWFSPLRASGQRTLAEQQGDDPFFLPDFLESLIDELQDGTVLPRLDWEHVAGTRFIEGILRPLVEEYLTYLALALALGVVLVDTLYFLLMRRLKRIGLPRPAKAAPVARPAKESAADAPSAGAPSAGTPAKEPDASPAGALVASDPPAPPPALADPPAEPPVPADAPEKRPW